MNLPRIAPAEVLALVVLILCGCSGDWNRDSIFFSGRKAQRLLEQQRQTLAETERSLEKARLETARLEGDLRAAQDSRETNQAAYRTLQDGIQRVAAELETTRSRLTAHAEATAQAEAERQRLSEEVARLEKRLDDLRDALLVLLIHR